MGGVSYQFKVLCFGLTTAPHVFTRLMAPISAILHRYGVRMLRYLDDWLILAESRTTGLQARDRLLQVCEELGLQINFRKSSLIPSQDMTYLGMQIQSVRFIAKPTATRVENLLKIIEEFLSSPGPHSSSLASSSGPPFVPYSSGEGWDVKDAVSLGSPQVQVGLPRRITLHPFGILCVRRIFYGGLGRFKTRGSRSFPPRARLELLLGRVRRRLGRHRRGTPSVRSLDSKPKGTLHQPQGDDGSAERPLRVRLATQRQDDRSLLRQCHDSRLPQAIGRHEVSGPVPQSERDSPVGRIHEDHASSPVHPGVSQHESGSSQSAQPGDRIGVDTTPGGGPRSSPSVAVDHRPVRDLADSKAPSVLCSSVGTQNSGGRSIPPALGQSSGICFSSHSHHKESSSQTESLSQLRSDSPRPLLASKRMVSRYAGTSIRHSNRTTQTSRSAATSAFQSVSRKSPYASSDCVATLKRFAGQAGFSETVAGQLAPCRRNSTRLNYQAHWGKFRKRC